MVNLGGIKRFIRRHIPDEWMARIRLHEHSRFVRTNVDVFLDDSQQQKLWLKSTPDTYRVRLSVPPEGTSKGVVTIGESSTHLRARALDVLADPEIDLAVVAETSGPGLKGRRRAEPVLGVLQVAIRESDLIDLGGLVPGDDPAGILARARDGGLRIGLVPVPNRGQSTRSLRPITRDTVVILTMVPIHDIGGGSRSSQLALEYVEQGFHVVLVNLFEAQESVDLGLRFVHPHLEQLRIDTFNPETLHSRVDRPGQVIVEAPERRLTGPAFALQDLGWELIYDLIDDWTDPALGGSWYMPDEEEKLVRRADRCVASAPDLADRFRNLGREPTLVPNAVNEGIFGAQITSRPADLPAVEIILGYHGSLYGDWFDWESLKSVAENFPDSALVVIGDDKAKRIQLPDNVHFLGLKAQFELPSNHQHFRVGLLPFKVNPTTHAVSPLKVYEYLASGVNVAAPGLRSLEGLRGVFTADDLSRAVEAAIAAPRPDRRQVLSDHSWSERVASLTPSRHHSTTPVAAVTVVARPVKHWSQSERLVD